MKDEAAADFEKILEKKLKERDEVAKRELNLIFWGVPESTSDDNSLRRSHDSEYVLRIGQAIGVQDVNIVQVIRIGQRPKIASMPETEVKPRGILVKFTNKGQRRDMLRGSKNIQSCGNEFKNISITKDLTIAQRNESKKAREAVRKEYEDRVSKGEKNIKLKGRRIIKVNDSGSDSDGEGQLSSSLTQALSEPF